MATPLPDQAGFITYLASLAVEGETLLLVQQKLKTQKAGVCWIPLRPTDKKRIKESWAIYANTGSFKLDRMVDKLSASAANCEYVLCMVLDDIGTKSKVPPLAPTVILETSPGNYQYVYVFSEQPEKGEFAAAIRAIAEAGYTDPGSCNPVRNFRIPGSVNLKPGKEKFKTKLIEHEPEREFTLDDICKALGVTPGPSISSGLTPVKIKRTDDEILNWMNTQGMVLTPVNTQGWCGIICPNYEQHSDPIDNGARYNTNDRGFECFHAHCQDFTSQNFLDWVAENGGPVATHGADEKELVDTMTVALSKLAKDPKVIEQATKGLADMQKKQLGRVEKADLFNRFAYLASDDAYFDLDTRKEYPRSVFNAMFRHLLCKSNHTGSNVQASIFFDENREVKKSATLHGLTYAPGENALVFKRDGVYGNKWRDGRPAVDKTKAGSIAMWLGHGRTLIANEDELDHALNLMAYKLQNPHRKINHAVLHAGREGCGKDTFWAPFLWAVCGPDNDNRGYLDSQTLSTPWGYHLESEVLLINELREPTAAERHAIANNLKPVIAAPPDFLDVNRKGLHPYKALNRTFVLAFSNSRAPISLSSQDRRWFVVWSEAPRMAERDAQKLWGWYANGGFETIAAWLYRRDVSAFNPAANPPESEYKQTLIEGGMSTAQAFLVHIIKEGIGEFQAGIIGAPFYRVADRLQGQAPAGAKIHHAAVIEALQEAGWHNLGRLMSKKHPSKKEIWVNNKINKLVIARDLSRSDIRAMAERPVSLHVLAKEA